MYVRADHEIDVTLRLPQVGGHQRKGQESRAPLCVQSSSHRGDIPLAPHC